ncbi:MAG: hypothetical protein E7478_00915, partial [Ruminococcaceae bacterium]|nr:hypothetical protein [Oscillospiraceae bacterium]
MANIRTSDTCAHRANSGRTAKKFMKIVQICLALVVAVSLCACSGALNVTSVKSGHLTAYPDKTVGEAFDAFLGSPSWTAFTSEDGMEVVQCEGKCTYEGEEVNMIIQFIVEDGGETFSIYTMAIDGEPINKLLQIGF